MLTQFPGALPDGLYYVTVTWVNQNGEEGAPATVSTIATTSSTFLAGPGSAPANATGWNVYAGISPDAMYRQNSALLLAGQTWEQPAPLVQVGSLPGKGQKPAYLQSLPRLITERINDSPTWKHSVGIKIIQRLTGTSGVNASLATLTLKRSAAMTRSGTDPDRQYCAGARRTK